MAAGEDFGGKDSGINPIEWFGGTSVDQALENQADAAAKNAFVVSAEVREFVQNVDRADAVTLLERMRGNDSFSRMSHHKVLAIASWARELAQKEKELRELEDRASRHTEVANSDDYHRLELEIEGARNQLEVLLRAVDLPEGFEEIMAQMLTTSLQVKNVLMDILLNERTALDAAEGSFDFYAEEGISRADLADMIKALPAVSREFLKAQARFHMDAFREEDGRRGRETVKCLDGLAKIMKEIDKLAGEGLARGLVDMSSVAGSRVLKRIVKLAGAVQASDGDSFLSCENSFFEALNVNAEQAHAWKMPARNWDLGGCKVYVDEQIRVFELLAEECRCLENENFWIASNTRRLAGARGIAANAKRIVNGYLGLKIFDFFGVSLSRAGGSPEYIPDMLHGLKEALGKCVAIWQNIQRLVQYAGELCNPSADMREIAQYLRWQKLLKMVEGADAETSSA